MNTKFIMALALATILPLSMGGMLDVFATETAHDRVLVYGNSYYDHLDVCNLKDEVKYSVTQSGDTRTIGWSNAPLTIDCSSGTYTLDYVTAEFNRNNAHPVQKTFTYGESSWKTSYTNTNDNYPFNGGTQIWIVYN